MTDQFIIFGQLHLMSSSFVVIAIFLVCFLVKKLNIELGQKYGIFLVLYYIVDSYIRHSVRELHPAEFLPLHICSILFFIAGHGFYYKSTIAHQISFYLTYGLTLQTLITPALSHGPNSIEYYRFFITHGLVIFNATYAIFILKIPITFRSVIYGFLALQILMLAATPFNYFFDLNFIFISKKPPSPTPVDHFGPWPWYVLVVDLVCFIVFSTLFLITKLLSKIKALLTA